MYLTLLDTVQNFLNDIGQQIVDFAFGWLMKISPMMQALILIGLSILSIIGLISLIKWSVKVLVPLAIIGIFGILLYVFVLK
jgi:hypothetical protein